MSYSLYTFVFEFLGGSYISQVRAGDPGEAMRLWAEQLDIHSIEGLGEKTKKILIEELDDDYPTGISGVSNVWCFTVSPRGKFGLVNIIRTVQGGAC